MKAILVILFFCVVSQAQDRNGRDSHRTQQLNLLVGNWTVRWKDRIAPGQYVETLATARIENDSLAAILVEHFHGKRIDRDLTAVSFINLAHPNILQRVFKDSDHGEFLYFEDRSDSSMIRFLWQRTMESRRLMLKHEYQYIQADSFATLTTLSTNAGVTWDIVQQARYKRQP
ncbi:MAG: hypothetical protein M0R68_15235 [Bacteroidetes bacterium]|nr:hypothetical protein [Bacteroidota bacterium]